MKTKDQITLIKTVRKAIINGFLYEKSGSKVNIIGIRAAIAYIYGYYTDNHFIDVLSVNEIIPLFSFENAQIACRLKHEKMPKYTNNWSYWWDSSNKSSRLAYINWMIEQLNRSV
jgi:hypothetical protein